MAPRSCRRQGCAPLSLPGVSAQEIPLSFLLDASTRKNFTQSHMVSKQYTPVNTHARACMYAFVCVCVFVRARAYVCMRVPHWKLIGGSGHVDSPPHRSLWNRDKRLGQELPRPAAHAWRTPWRASGPGRRRLLAAAPPEGRSAATLSCGVAVFPSTLTRLWVTSANRHQRQPRGASARPPRKCPTRGCAHPVQARRQARTQGSHWCRGVAMPGSRRCWKLRCVAVGERNCRAQCGQ